MTNHRVGEIEKRYAEIEREIKDVCGRINQVEERAAHAMLNGKGSGPLPELTKLVRERQARLDELRVARRALALARRRR